MAAEDVLKQHNLRKTPTRIQVLNTYLGVEHALSYSDIEAALGVGYDRVTLYRTLATFEEKGVLHRVYDDAGTVKYSLCSSTCSEHDHNDHHVHFHCRACRRTLCLEHVSVPSVPVLDGFSVQDVYMVANGLCPECRADG